MLIISINKTERLAVTRLLAACHIMPPVNERSPAGTVRPDHPAQCKDTRKTVKLYKL